MTKFFYQQIVFTMNGSMSKFSSPLKCSSFRSQNIKLVELQRAIRCRILECYAELREDYSCVYQSGRRY